MSIISRMRKQYAIYWQRTGFDNSGRPTFATPVGIKCRWDDKTVEFVSAQGKVLNSKSIVYPDRDMEPDDMLMEIDVSAAGDIDGLTEEQIFSALVASLTSTDPYKNDAEPIQAKKKTPNLKATETLYTMML